MRSLLPKLRYLLLLSVVSLGACGVKTVYNQLDWVLLGMAEDYIQLTDEQDTDVKRRIDRVIEWHRKTQLPAYSKDLLQLKADKQAGLTYEKLARFSETLDQRWHSIKQRLVPDISSVLLTLNDEQQRYLFEVIREKNDEFIEKYVDISQQERNEKITERVIESLELWFGELNDTQRKQVEQRVEKFKPVSQDRLEFRRVVQKELRLVLKSRMPVKDKYEELVRLFSMPEMYQSAVYRDKLAFNRKQVLQLILELDFTREQDAHFYHQIDDYVLSFHELAAEVI